MSRSWCDARSPLNPGISAGSRVSLWDLTEVVGTKTQLLARKSNLLSFFLHCYFILATCATHRTVTGLISALDEDCMQKGIEFIPARLMQKRPKDTRGEVSRGRTSKQGNSVWAPSSSEEDGDSEDSMSDLYPCQSSLGLIPSKHISLTCAPVHFWNVALPQPTYSR